MNTLFFCNGKETLFFYPSLVRFSIALLNQPPKSDNLLRMIYRYESNFKQDYELSYVSNLNFESKNVDL